MDTMNDTVDLYEGCLDQDQALRNAHLTYISETGRIVVGAVSCAVATLGVFTNLVNILVFRCQGFQDTVNISLLALAVSDLLTLVAILTYNVIVICELTGRSLAPQDFSFLASWPIFSFALNSCWIAVFISVERCLCVRLPLKVKDIISPKVTVLSIAIIFSLGLATMLPALSAMRINSYTTEANNDTVLAISFSSDREILELVSYIMMMFFQKGSFVCLLFSTVTLIISLQRKVRKRLRELTVTPHVSNRQPNRSMKRAKEDRVVKMVILVSVLILITFCPGLALNIAHMFRIQFNFGREEEWLARMMWAFVYVLYSFNASINMVIYYKMSSKYRKTLISFVGRQGNRTDGSVTHHSVRTPP